MSLNCEEINAILNELPLSGSLIQKIRQPNFHSLVFDIYNPGKRYRLLIDLAQGKTRIHRITANIRNELKLQRFAQFLRSRISGGRIISAEQIFKERIIRFLLKRGGEETLLWLRLWGGAANVIATDNQNKILDAFYRRPKKNEISGEIFHPPREISKKSKNFSIRELPGEMGFNEKIEKFYLDLNNKEELETLRNKSIREIKQQEAKIQSAIFNLTGRLKDYRNKEEFKQFGDLIKNNMFRIKKGDTSVSVENYFNNNELTEIKLDPGLSPSENFEKLYKKYRKAKSGLKIVQNEIDEQNNKLLVLKNELDKLSTEKDPETFKRILKTNKSSKVVEIKNKIPGKVFFSGNFQIIVGKSAKENDNLLRRFVRGNDYWLHTRDFPGAYVFIKNISGQSIPLETLLDAGNLALYFSKGRNSGKGELYYTRVKYLKRAKNTKIGTVLPTQEKNLSIKIDPERIRRLTIRET